MGFHNRQRKQARNSGSRNRARKFLIVCEGEVTERQYFEGLKRYIGPLVDLHVSKDHGVPVTLVNKAKVLKRLMYGAAVRGRDVNLVDDQVWCVFDVDEHPNISLACETARANGISVAISNPSFELWLLLHFQDPPGCQTRQKMMELLKVHLPEYDKHANFSELFPQYDAAKSRAEALDAIASKAGTPGHNPTTGVYRLTEEVFGSRR